MQCIFASECRQLHPNSCLHIYRGLFGHKRNIQYTADVANLAFVFIILRVIQVYYAKLDSMAFSLHPVNC